MMQTKEQSDLCCAESMKIWLEKLSENELVEAMTFSFDSDSDGTGKCHEYELFRQMIALQSPPPTPIHPRAMGVKLASVGIANDGRDELQRVMKNRFVRPRLFQFIERRSNNNFEMDHGLASLPPEIAAMVRKENNLGKRSNKIAKDQFFDVLARKFQTPWGQILSVGPTKEMRDADEQLLMGTCIQNGCRLLAGGDGRLDYCTFQRHSQGKILRMLHVVSRGRAFRYPPIKSNGTVFASWFVPTQDWFSLPTFLASRFEVALWRAFRGKGLNNQRTTIIEDVFSRSSPGEINNCGAIAIARALKKTMMERIAAGIMRDLFSYQYFSHVVGRSFANDFNDLDCSRLHLIPIVLLSSPIDKFRLMVVKEVELEISQLVKRELLSNAGTLNQGLLTLAQTKNKKRKKKRRKKRNHPRSKPTSLVKIDEKEVEDYPSSSSEVSTSSLLLSNSDDEERNNNIIVVLGVIHDVMEDVFAQLGLDSETENNDGFQVSKNQSSRRKSKNDPKTFILNKTKKKMPSTERRAITMPQSIDNVDLTTIQFTDNLEENQPTLDRNTPSLSLWGTQSQHTEFRSGISQDQEITNLFSAQEHIDKLVPNDFFGLRHDGAEDFLYGGKSENQGFSLFSDFFDVSTGNHDKNFASSTGASIASSILDNDDDSSSLQASSDEEDKRPTPVTKQTSLYAATAFEKEELNKEQSLPPKHIRNLSDSHIDLLVPSMNSISLEMSAFDSGDVKKEVEDTQLPEFPSSPPAQPSPILLSLADLGELRRIATLRKIKDIDEEDNSVETVDDSGAHSLASSPGPKRSFSREDLRILIDNDTAGRKRWPPCSSRTVDHSAVSYRNAARKNSRKARSLSSHDITESTRRVRTLNRNPSMKSFTREIKEVIIDRGDFNLNACARSESALDDHEDSSHWNVIPNNVVDENDNATTTRDGATTISSIPTPYEIDEMISLREERDTYRDMCLTMAAEISKLKNTLALERINSNYSMPQSANPFGSEYMPSFFQEQRQGSAGRYVAMSDAGLNEVPMSEDGNNTDGMQASVATTDLGKRRISRSNSIGIQHHKSGGSDIVSLDYDNTAYSVAPPSQYIPCYKCSGPNHLHGLQSRLSREIEEFLISNSLKLKKQESRRLLAIERLTRLVTAIWPRAQVLAYGSQETGLRLPSSDLDFVISLPEVHKKAPADAPGDLEGRNAINESSQKLLARKLKSESWIGMCYLEKV